MILVKIKTDGAAFEDDPREVSRVLHKLADRLAENPGLLAHSAGPLLDVNGNNAGHWITLPDTDDGAEILDALR